MLQYLRQCQETEIGLRDTVNSQLSILRSAGLQNHRDQITINELQQQIVNLHDALQKSYAARSQIEREARQRNPP